MRKVSPRVSVMNVSWYFLGKILKLVKCMNMLLCTYTKLFKNHSEGSMYQKIGEKKK